MSIRFPHLSDTKFPNVETVNPFDIKLNFDYTRWGIGTKLKICNVNWCVSGEDAVKFADDTARDAYFDAIPGASVTIETAARILPDGSVKVPLPFDEIVKYNYLMVDFSTATSDENKLPYETDEHLSRFYFFVVSCEYAAPNTTNCRLALDAWTTYINRIEIKYMMLNRGHAPISVTSVDEYLENPAKNNKYLLAPDVNFGETPSIVSAGEYMPFNNGPKIMLIASTVSLTDLSYLKKVKQIIPSSPTYSDAETRDGYQTIISDWNIGAGKYDYSGLNLPITTATTGGGSIPNNVSVYGLPASEVYGDNSTFWADVASQCPQFLETIQAVYFVEQDLVELDPDDYVGFCGYKIYNVKPQIGNDKLLLSLNREAFSFDPKYAEYAKLYTYPYASIEVSSDSGEVAEIKVENIDSNALKTNYRVSLAYPYIRFDAFLVGIASGQKVSYKWVDVSGKTHSADIPLGDFREYTYGYDIPAYCLYWSGYEQYCLHNYNDNNVRAKHELELAYENAVHSANTAYENALDANEAAYENAIRSAQTGYDNASAGALAAYQNALDSNELVQDNTNRSADTSYSNSSASATTAQTNANASAATANANTIASAAAANTNAQNSATTAYTNTIASADTAHSNAYTSAETDYTNSEAAAGTNKTVSDRSATAAQTNANNTATNMTTNNGLQVAAATSLTNEQNSNASDVTSLGNELNQAKQAWNAGLSRTLQGIDIARAAVNTASGFAANLGTAGASGSVSGVVGAVVSGAVNAVGTAVTLGLDTAATEAAIANSQAQLNETNQNNIDITGENTATASTLNQLQNTLATNTTANDASTLNANALNTYNATVQNNVDGYNTAIANAGRTQTTAKDIADATQATATSNATATRDTAQANATRSYNTNVDNADATQATAIANAERAYNTDTANAERTQTTTKTNAQESRGVADANAKRTYDAAVANAGRTQSASNANAANTRDVANDNALYARNTIVSNEQRNMEIKPQLIRDSYLDHVVDAPVQIGERSGDPLADEYKWRGIVVKVKTQKPSAIAQAGDTFARWGYALNQQWEFTDFNLMKNFTHWKCDDLWLVGDAGVIESAQEKIKGMLMNGVTVWSDPEKIGGVSIYDN